MSVELLTIWASRGDDRYPVQLVVSTANECTVTATSDHWPELPATGLDLFEALTGLRLTLEPLGVVLHCNGARVDVYPSQMQRQATAGRMAYVMVPQSTVRPKAVDIFAPAKEGSLLGSVSDQRAWFDRWMSEPAP